MSDYRVKGITIDDGKVYLTVRESGTKVRGWVRGTIGNMEGQSVYKQLCMTGRMLYDGRLKLAKSSRCQAKKAYESCKRRHGTWRSNYDDRDEKMRRERFAREFARRMCI